jgi:hypothetical protein
LDTQRCYLSQGGPLTQVHRRHCLLPTRTRHCDLSRTTDDPPPMPTSDSLMDTLPAPLQHVNHPRAPARSTSNVVEVAELPVPCDEKEDTDERATEVEATVGWQPATYDGDDDTPPGAVPWHAAQLTRRGRGTRGPQLMPTMVVSTSLSAPRGKFILLYLCSGPGRVGDVSQQLAAHDSNVKISLVDMALGGASHDLRDENEVKQLEILATRDDCIAVLVAPPCHTFSALQFQQSQGAPGPCRDIDSPDGFVVKSTLDPRAAEGNFIVCNCLRVVQSALSHDAAFRFESPVSRGINSTHAIPGKEKHATLWDTSFWREFAMQVGDHYGGFDQCALTSDATMPRGLQKRTRLACDARTLPHLQRCFATCKCIGDHIHQPVLQPRNVSMGCGHKARPLHTTRQR